MENTLSYEDILNDIRPDLSKKEDEKEMTIEDVQVEEETTVEEEKEEVVDTKDKKEETEPPKNSQEDSVETETDKSKEAPKQDSTEESPYYKVLKSNLSSGKWEDVVLVDEDGKETPISEIKNLDEETFIQIQEDQNSAITKKFEENHISVKDLDERRRQIADIVVKGGDLKEIFGSQENVESYLDPFKGVDIEDEKVQSNIYYNYLKNKGYSDKAAQFEIQEKIKELSLDTEVKSIIEDTKKKAKDYVTSKQKELDDKIQEEKKLEREYKKSLAKVLKERNVDDTRAKKYVDLATKKTEEGDFAIDSLYNKMMQDPETAPDLIAFISDPETFKKEFRAKATTEAAVEARRKVKFVKPKDRTPEKQEKKEGFEIEMAEGQ